MANSQPKRPKTPPPKLNLEEMEQDPSMRGMLSFLEISPNEKLEMLRKRTTVDQVVPALSPAPIPDLAAPKLAAPELEALPESAPEPTAPTLPPPTVGAPVLAHPPEVTQDETAAPELAAPTVGALSIDTPNPGAPEVDALDLDVYVYRRTGPLLHPAITVQDGHTHGEQALFGTLFRLARPSSSGPFRVISIGERTLASEVPMAYSTVQQNVRSLVSKLAIDVRINKPQQPKTYLVYSYEEILRRRRAAGLTHVIRRTSGVTLVNPDHLSSGAPNSGASTSNFGAASAGAPELR
jgi:hypothetical protein